MTLHDLINQSQKNHATRYLAAADLSPSFGSKLGAWGSHHAAIKTAICMLNGTINSLNVTINCPQSELL